MKIQNPLPFDKFCQKLANGDVTKSTELYRIFIAAGSIAGAISYIKHIVLWPQNKFCPNPAVAAFIYLSS